MTIERPDILAALRDATASRHAELDGGMPLARPCAALDDYRDHLALLRRWLEPVEAWQARFADGPQDAGLLAPAPHLPLIEADLADASLPPVDAALPPAQWQGRDSAAYRWGVAYVIEGSRLGGAVLYRRLAERLAPHPLRYLHNDGVPPGPRWQQFMRALRAHVQGQAAIAEACQGARDAFDSLIALRRAAGDAAQSRAAA
ncbi:biliverdin-producing heme oxygenase [Pseudoduganella dura]|uniref:biliverdin-producing heme oxygenase n=1 Tax=Pseudoduganella dura TaxID=321982 RepID=UPI00167BD26E|nr:biliverdin-producing heme oxygenase [Pseudoduganella dura]GGY15425.1 heme oxygenase BphO [Pseudoduganella dura]